MYLFLQQMPYHHSDLMCSISANFEKMTPIDNLKSALSIVHKCLFNEPHLCTWDSFN